MGDLFGALIGFLVLLMIAPIVIFAIVVGLGFAAVGVALSILFTVLGLAIHLLFWAAPFLLVLGLLYLVFRPSSSKRELARH
jgi:asparagine N-glycosylation enzyme membrane subunit Stt3